MPPVENYFVLVVLFGVLWGLVNSLRGSVGSFRSGWTYLSGEQMVDKVLTESRDATYYRGKGSPRDPVSKDMVVTIFERDKGQCVHCGAKCYLGQRSAQDIEAGLRKAYLGHSIPNAIGGTEDKGNLHISCDDCNREMGSTLILAPAIRFAASRKETICMKGLTIAADCETVIDYQNKKLKMAA